MRMSRAAIIYVPKLASPKNRRILRRRKDQQQPVGEESPMKFILKCSKSKQNPTSKSRSHPLPRPKNELKRIFFQYTDKSSELCKKNHES